MPQKANAYLKRAKERVDERAKCETLVVLKLEVAISLELTLDEGLSVPLYFAQRPNQILRINSENSKNTIAFIRREMNKLLELKNSAVRVTITNESSNKKIIFTLGEGRTWTVAKYSE